MEVNWNEAPEWADRLMRHEVTGRRYWANIHQYLNVTDGELITFNYTKGSIDDFKLTEMRPDNWKEGEKRMEQIAQNGNGGEVYSEADNVNHPEHYQSDNGIECIDAIRAALGREGFIAYCRGNAIKYNWRSGSKEAHAEDLKKGAWYSNRAAQELENDK